MIKKLSSRFVLGLVLTCGSLVSQAVPVTIVTNYIPPTPAGVPIGIPYNTLSQNVPPQFITFTVKNNNAYPIKITDLGSLHLGGIFFSAALSNFTNNGSTYVLWGARYNPPGTVPIVDATANNAALAPDIRTNNGWDVLGSSASPISNGATNGIIPVVTGMNNAYVLPGDTRRFAMSINDTIAEAVNGNPTAFTASGVTLTTSGAYAGNLQPANTPAYIINMNFFGSITFDQAGPRPPAVALSAPVICKGSCVTLTATADAYVANPIFKFYRPGGGEILQLPSDPPNARTLCNMETDSNGTYVVTVTDGALTSDAALVKIGVTDPKAPLLDGKFDYCLNESFTPVTVIGLPTATFLYYYGPTGGSPIPFVPYFNTTTAHEDIYYVSQLFNGCESPRTKITYRAAPKPNAPIVTTPIVYCEGAPSVPLTANGQKPLYWYYQPTGGISSVIPPTPNTSKLDSFVYYVSQKVDGCEGDRSKVNVVVAKRPNGLIVPSRTEICMNDTLTLRYYGSALGSESYNWTFPSGATPSGEDSTPIVLQLDSPGTAVITLSVGVSYCYSPTYTQLIKVDQKPRGTIQTASDLCEGQRTLVSMSSYTPTVDSFFWDFDGGVVANASTDQGPYGVTWSEPGKKTIMVRLTDGLCSFVETDTAIVHPKPDATFTVTGLTTGTLERKEPFCADDSVLLTPNTVSSFSQYSWFPTRFFDVYSNIPVTYAHLDYQDTMSIRLTVTDQYGCMNTVGKVIKTQACCEIIFPTAFSPNGDGRNDYFHPVMAGRQDIRTMKVMNRWGQTVYESGANFPNMGWDGKMNGKDGEMGSYYYFVSYKCAGKVMEQKGEIVLVR